MQGVGRRRLLCADGLLFFVRVHLCDAFCALRDWEEDAERLHFAVHFHAFSCMVQLAPHYLVLVHTGIAA
jgi:hypothetical protein